ncbi:probable auxin efflux carrier component 8 [Dioscorea cayenensis subsp. rotundata]|uniref:Auxin efflux carrier component n=1 Tax=Dioscorea cayennensis subsp. rotundata TaxID=55577 RepID=A0AB40AU71_DIOCR|nr:probable auxin efflux carrier component 8 [Dioscorea cayenensis subsp. rotundata]
MISGANVYRVFEAIIPLYVAMLSAYISKKWWKLFTPDQCSGINKFVAKFSIPLLSFQVISSNNPYKMNLKLILSDTTQKLLAIFIFIIFVKLRYKCSLDWLITGFSLSTLPNTLIIGLPLLKAMYGDEASKLLSQIIVLQSLVWYTLLLFLFEVRAADEIIPDPTDSSNESEAPEGIQIKPETDEVKTLSPRGTKTHHILRIVGRKLLKNPNTHSCLAGFIWALIVFKWGVKLPAIVASSIAILSDGGLGMAMFSLGLFMASQPKLVACGIRMAALSMGIKFILGPALMAISSYAVGLRGTLLSIAIVQAALPQGIVPFVFAREYGVHPEILSTGVIIGMLIAIPIALAYYLVLDHIQ